MVAQILQFIGCLFVHIVQSGEVVQSQPQLPHHCWGSSALCICLSVHLLCTKHTTGHSPEHLVQCILAIMNI